jgi:hypothetical protein
MVDTSRSGILEVFVAPDRPPRWTWEVTCSDKVIANGIAAGQVEARFEGFNAMFLLLAAGWNP